MTRPLPFFACLLAAGLTLSATGAAAESAKFQTGTRSGAFVTTDKSLTDLVSDGYDIKGNLGTALILQKEASVFSCQIPPDPENLDFKPYFVCAELREEPREAEEPADKPRPGN
ncbi:MAG: hypothetical protein U0942_12500 [Parvibaculum sp.]|uniref:hypothetical protein n=1 Tax=Parvibaculum sp. TaxID=2024848 RepID=UPI002ABB8643|nr:hypothetical protein [Parvibaculum sp.]MDZ4382149.1 hypothetical protein [Parvibaculum sp.]